MISFLLAVQLSLSSVVWFVFTLCVAGLIFWLLFYLVDYFKLPEPINKVAKAVLVLLMIFFLINELLGLIAQPIIHWK